MHSGDNVRCEFVRDQFSASFRHFERTTQQALRGRRTQANDDFRLDNGDFGFQPRPARKNFHLVRLSVNSPFAARLPFEVLHRVGDIDLATIDSRDIESLVENTTRWPNERPSFQVFFIARLFANKEHSGLAATFAENCLCAELIEIATGASSGSHSQVS